MDNKIIIKDKRIALSFRRTLRIIIIIVWVVLYFLIRKEYKGDDLYIFTIELSLCMATMFFATFIFNLMEMKAFHKGIASDIAFYLACIFIFCHALISLKNCITDIFLTKPYIKTIYIESIIVGYHSPDIAVVSSTGEKYQIYNLNHLYLDAKKPYSVRIFPTMRKVYGLVAK